MRVRTLAILSAAGTGTRAQTPLETTDFNVIEALLEQGVDVSSIPALATLVERSSNSACAIAVSSTD